jgi:uncharacterized SAM-binding protein YcdF (DUF218 family)
VFFVLSKTLGVMSMPSNLMIGIGLLGVVLCATRFASLGRKLMIVSIVLLAICGLSPLGYWLLYPLEARFPPWNPAQGAPDGIIVLGGPVDPDLSAAHDTAVITSAADRIFAAAVLARQYPNARVVYTGGNANLISNNSKEADYAGRLLENLGIPKSRLTMERESRNTEENAEFSKELVQPKSGERWLLVTSAYHMPRSVGLFRKAAFAVEPYPVDWRTDGPGALLEVSDLASRGLMRTDLALHEWLGLLASWSTGKIDRLFPGPNN